MIIKILYIIFLSVTILSANESKLYKIGVLSIDLKKHTIDKWEKTAEYLTSTIKNSKFEIIPMTYNEINLAMKERKIDFLLTNPAHYIIHEKNAHLFRLATVIYSKKGTDISSFGGVILTLADRDDIKSIKDLKNKKIAAVKKGSLGGYQAQLKEMLDNNLPVPNEKDVTFTDMPHRKTIQLLKSKKVDVAFLRTSVLEDLIDEKEIDINNYKVINKKYADYPFYISTTLYPEWPFAALSHIDNETKKTIAESLFKVKSTDEAAIKGNYKGWYIPLDYNVVTEMLRELRLPPFDHELKFTLEDIVKKYKILFIIFVISLITLIIYLLIVNIKLYKSRKSLNKNAKKLNFLVYNDSLTHLANKNSLSKEIEKSIESNIDKFTLMILDIDHFKDINDSYGHATGDQLLKNIATNLRNKFQHNNHIVYSLSGDEFAILLKHVDKKEVIERIAYELIAFINKTIILQNNMEVKLSSSIGISTYPSNGESFSEIYRSADAALFAAKEKGRRTFAYYDEKLTKAAKDRVEIESKLKEAISNNELILFYQPQVCLKTNKVVGAEALIRWIKKDGTIIPPFEFIPVAEETGLIHIISNFVIEEASKQIKLWLNNGIVNNDFVLAINISAKQFYDDNLVRTLKNKTNSFGVDPKNLEIELTESALVNKEAETILILNSIKELGFNIALDDFGTGYSSLSYLKMFPLDVLKIDKSFVDDISSEQHDKEVVTTIISIGHKLGFKVLAEGVETTEQLQFLTDNDCDVFQGYLKSKPLPAKEFELLLD